MPAAGQASLPNRDDLEPHVDVHEENYELVSQKVPQQPSQQRPQSDMAPLWQERPAHALEEIESEV